MKQMQSDNDILTAVLLEQTGEADAGNRSALAADPEAARSELAELDALQSLACSGLEQAGPSEACLAQLRLAAESRCARGRVIRFPAQWRVIAATAAALALILGVWISRGPGSAIPPPTDTSQLHALLTLMDPSVDWEAGEGPAENADMAELAEHLMVMQGFGLEDLTTTEEAEPQGPQPTTSLYRSRLAHQARKYG